MKALGRKHARLIKREKESNAIRQEVIQAILKLIPISEQSQLETKEGVSNPKHDHRGSEMPQMHPRVRKES